MRLDFIPNVNEHGESVVRLFQFKKEDCTPDTICFAFEI